ncbi:MAG: hypothetical protein LBQ31_06930 [Bacteroidales bacterium]|jgi:microcystin-dependent protein|nr:hypothetical protein [Bacteroidales bacterium]
MKTKIIVLVCASFILSVSNAQIGINTLTPDTNVVLDINHSSKGILLPRVSSGVRSATKQTAPDGSLVYDNSKKEFFYKNAGSSGDWIVLNPFTAKEGSGDIYLSSPELGRNVSIGNIASIAAKARLDVNGKIRAADSLIGKTIKIEGEKVANLRRDGSDLRISSGGKIILDKEVNVSGGSLTVTSGNITVSGNNTFVGYGTIPIGGIILWSGSVSSLPDGWSLCDGLNGTPNLKGKFVVGYNSGSSDYNSIGKTGGAENVTLTVAQMPSHNHEVKVRGKVDQAPSAGQYVFDDADGANYTEYTEYSGGGQAHENRPPYYVLAYIMRKK